MRVYYYKEWPASVVLWASVHACKVVYWSMPIMCVHACSTSISVYIGIRLDIRVAFYRVQVLI